MSRFNAAKPWVDPAKVASDTLARSGQPRLSNGRAIDVESIAREFCKIEPMFVPGLNSSGKPLLGLYSPVLNAIVVNSDSIEVRQRFTVAHEIGHVQLEYSHGNAKSLFGDEQPETYECTVDDEGLSDVDERKAGLRRVKEIRANQFAAHLLMPEGLVREIWREEHEDLERVAHALQVSKESLGYRLRGLRLV
jgi:Zn-dependent peptidase ImmA (M78 family)